MRKQRLQKSDSTAVFKQLERCVTIDKDNLDEEIVQFPEVFYQVCIMASDSEAHLNECRLIRQETEAGLQEEARVALSGEGRVTNVAVNAWIKASRQYKKADRAYQDAKALHGRWAALKEALQAKSYKLRDLVDLYIAQYYSDPSSSDGSTTRRRRAIREASGRV